MSYAIRKDGLGWRAVSGPDDVGLDETYSETQPAPVAPSAADQVKAQIAELEAQVTPRRMREAVLGTDGGWLAAQDAAIAALRAKL